MQDEMVFDSLEPIRVPVKIAGKQYVLQEASEDTASQFQNMAVAGARMDDGKVIGVANLGNLEPFLVSRCLWEIDGDPSDPQVMLKARNVSEKVVRSWPSRIVKPLFERAKKISGLDRGDSPERKALLAAIDRGLYFDGDTVITLDRFRAWVSALTQQDKRLFEPLWELVKPAEEDSAKN